MCRSDFHTKAERWENKREKLQCICRFARIDVGVLRWFGHVERMDNDRFAKKVYVGECVGSRSVGRPRKR